MAGGGGSGRRWTGWPASLLTVFYGLGIFTANAAYERRPRPNGRGKQPLARGYLREAALSEALAYYALLRGERNPDWDRHLVRRSAG